MIRRIVLLLLALLLLCPLASCGGRENLEISEEEALAVLTDLVPRSHEINVIFFGEGLPTEGGHDEYTETAYFPVTSDCKYQTVRQIRAAAEKIYSMSYLESVYVTAFVGMTATSEDGLLDNNVSPRYKEINGKLSADASYRGLNIRGKLTVTACEIEKKTPDYVAVKTECLDENGEKVTLTLLLTLENDVWLLDGPTY